MLNEWAKSICYSDICELSEIIYVYMITTKTTDICLCQLVINTKDASVEERPTWQIQFSKNIYV